MIAHFFSIPMLVLVRKNWLFCHYTVVSKLTLMGLIMVVDALWLKSPGQPTHVRSITWNWSYFVLALIPGARLMILAPSDTLLSKFSWRAQPTGDAAIILKSWPWMIFYMAFSMYIRRCNPRYILCNKKICFYELRMKSLQNKWFYDKWLKNWDVKFDSIIYISNTKIFSKKNEVVLTCWTFLNSLKTLISLCKDVLWWTREW